MAADSPLPRLTRTVVEQLIKLNPDLNLVTNYSDRNSRFTNVYTVAGEDLMVQRSGRVPFEGTFSREPVKVDIDSVRGLIRRNPDAFSFDGIDPSLPAKTRPVVMPTPAPAAPPVEEIVVFESKGALETFLASLTPKQKLALGGGILVASGLTFVAVKYGPDLMRDKVIPGVKRLFARRQVVEDEAPEDGTDGA